MTRVGLCALLGTLALAIACAPTAPTVRHSMGRGFSYQVKSDVKEVEPGHWAGSWENRGLCLDNVGQKDEEPGILTASGTFDAVWTSGPEVKSCTSKGRATCTFRDGSSHTDETTADCLPGPGGLLVFVARGAFVGGTGRFEGIQGSVSSTTWSLTPVPESLGFSKVTAEVTLPKK